MSTTKMINRISATIIADSKNNNGERITTFILVYPRCLHSEVMTHRMFSRNAASSRAVPFLKLIDSIKENPFIPIAWQKEHSGMQGTEYVTDPERIKLLEEEWLEARDHAILHATRIGSGEIASDDPNEFEVIPVTKQLCNRLLEPYQYYTTIVTATDFENFFSLRCPIYNCGDGMTFRSKKDFVAFYNKTSTSENQMKVDDFDQFHWFSLNKGMAEIHLMDLAEKMWDLYNEHEPNLLEPGQWHIPFGDNIDYEKLGEATAEYCIINHPNEEVDINKWLIKVATARCARVSYTVVGEEGKKVNYKNDFDLHDRLSNAGHWSCFEHCARAFTEQEEYDIRNGILNYYMNGSGTRYSGNFKGFVQYRKTFESENKK